MGGGDLNLKKSWHPSTMRNIEKVWKAEQRNDQEQKRIAELQKEIREEREREDLQKYAQEKGVIEKKDDVKLDWMYKGPSSMVDREEYLLGKSIDKSFEHLQQGENPNAFRVDTGGIPASILRGADHQVDLAKKLHEDPLNAIKKKEIESKTQLLKNPVKLKQLKKLLEKDKSPKSKKHKKKSKKHKKSKSDDDSDQDIDNLLISMYSKLKDKVNVKEMLKNESSSESEREDSSRKSNLKKNKHEPKYESNRNMKNYATTSTNSSRPNYERNKYPKKTEKRKLTEEEMEKRRQEMMDNAKWRDKEREKNVKRYKAEENKEKEEAKKFDKDFVRKQLSKASYGTVESRIKSNINNIQRSQNSMSQNFARR